MLLALPTPAKGSCSCHSLFYSLSGTSAHPPGEAMGPKVPFMASIEIKGKA